MRVFDGAVPSGGRLRMMSTGVESESLEVGVFLPGPTGVDELSAGEVGYIATGLKRVGDAPMGDTITLAGQSPDAPLKGYQPLKPTVFAGLYPADGEDYVAFRGRPGEAEAQRCRPDLSAGELGCSGSGFRCGFLGLLHMDIVQERLEREYDLSLLATSPSVAYRAVLTDGAVVEIDNPAKLPPSQTISEIQEPWLDMNIIGPSKLRGRRHGVGQRSPRRIRRMEYLQHGGSGDGDKVASTTRVLLEYSVPLSEVLVNFYDQLKARTQGYASMDYSLAGYRPADLVRLDILVGGEPVDAPIGNTPQGSGV